MIKSLLPTYISFIQNIGLPSKADWQVKIDDLIEQYKRTKDLPRKKKKKIRKELNSKYSFYCALRDYNPFNFLYHE